MLQIKLLDDGSIPPKRAHPEDAGLDLFYTGKRDIVIKAGAKSKVGTGFAMSVPAGYVAKIYPRSGLGTAKEIVLANLVGIVDSTYRGEVFVTLKNNGKEDFILKHGERFAQMLVSQCMLWSPSIVKELPDTARGAKGHGATGK